MFCFSLKFVRANQGCYTFGSSMFFSLLHFQSHLNRVGLCVPPNKKLSGYSYPPNLFGLHFVLKFSYVRTRPHKRELEFHYANTNERRNFIMLGHIFFGCILKLEILSIRRVFSGKWSLRLQKMHILAGENQASCRSNWVVWLEKMNHLGETI